MKYNLGNYQTKLLEYLFTTTTYHKVSELKVIQLKDLKVLSFKVSEGAMYCLDRELFSKCLLMYFLIYSCSSLDHVLQILSSKMASK